MKTELDCNIVRDMLPMYIEKLTSEESNVAIRQHLERCEDCMRHFENLKKLNYYLTASDKEKKSFKRKNYILAAIIAAVCIVVLGIFFRYFIVGVLCFKGAPIKVNYFGLV